MSRRRAVGLLLLALWAVLFVGGALGELLDLEGLRRLTDPKGLFLR